ncbi:MAG: hypothetical protein HC904_01395 [Blastochloris sp.]|nr:hypothetical protein [Blastochloris sp.]
MESLAQTQVEDFLPDPDLQAEKLGVLHRLTEEKGSVVLVTERGWSQGAPQPEALLSKRLKFRQGAELPMEKVLSQLERSGYVLESLAMQRGQMARRGGILDVFSWHASLPLRVEWFGDEIESIREFDPAQQLSVRNVEQGEVLLGQAGDSGTGTVQDYLPKGHRRIVCQGGETSAAAGNSRSTNFYIACIGTRFFRRIASNCCVVIWRTGWGKGGSCGCCVIMRGRSSVSANG